LKYGLSGLDVYTFDLLVHQVIDLKKHEDHPGNEGTASDALLFENL